MFLGNGLKIEGGSGSDYKQADTCQNVSPGLPVVRAESDMENKQESNDTVLSFSSIEDARAHGLSLGPSFRSKTSKAGTNWRFRCRELHCPAGWSIKERSYTDESTAYVLTANLNHDHGQVAVEPKHFSCDVKGCDFKADTIKCLKDHKHKDHKVTQDQKTRNFKCRWCDHSTVCQTYLTNHVNAVHLSFKPYKCDQCTYSNSTAMGLKDHVQKKHGEGKERSRKQCDQCEFTYQGCCHMDLLSSVGITWNLESLRYTR